MISNFIPGGSIILKTVPNLIISCSRRTDIPAFYSEWFANRLAAGFVDVPNPVNVNMVSRISLKPEEVDAIVFWSKNPAPFFKLYGQLQNQSIPEWLDEKGFNYYFQFTVNDYPEELECNLPSIEKRIDTFLRLSDHFRHKGIGGVKRVIWRYDPIILSKNFNAGYHFEKFNHIAVSLKGYTDRCIISIVDLYKKTERGLSGIENLNADPASPEIKALLSEITKSAGQNGINVFSCAEEQDYEEIGIAKGHCVDGDLIEKLSGISLDKKINTKDKGQREACGCIVSRDIGMNHTCLHGCVYCYSTSSQASAKKNMERHDPLSSMLIGKLTGIESVYEISRKEKRTPKPAAVSEQGQLVFE